MPNNNEAAPRGGLFLFLLLDEKEPKNQGQNHRPSARPPKRLTFKSGSDFCKVKRKRPSLKVKRLVVPWATAAPRFGRARAPSPVWLWRSRTRCPVFSLSFLTTHSRFKPSWRTRIRHPLHRQRTTFYSWVGCLFHLVLQKEYSNTALLLMVLFLKRLK